MIAVRQARVPDIPRRMSFIRSVSTIVAFRVALKWLKSDSGASLRHSIPTIMLRTANVPRRKKQVCHIDFHCLSANCTESQLICTVPLLQLITVITWNRCRWITLIYPGPSGEQCPWRNMGWGERKRNRDRWQEAGLRGGQMPCLERTETFL